MVAGYIREDLFYRINILHIRLELLRAKVADMVPQHSAPSLFNSVQTHPSGADTIAPK
jgi:transcriptional regulator of aromatic amino acid metabolism